MKLYYRFREKIKKKRLHEKIKKEHTRIMHAVGAFLKVSYVKRSENAMYIYIVRTAAYIPV